MPAAHMIYHKAGEKLMTGEIMSLQREPTIICPMVMLSNCIPNIYVYKCVLLSTLVKESSLPKLFIYICMYACCMCLWVHMCMGVQVPMVAE